MKILHFILMIILMLAAASLGDVADDLHKKKVYPLYTLVIILAIFLFFLGFIQFSKFIGA